jgi:hypothetical protein
VSEGPVSIGYLLVMQLQMLVVTLPIGLITLWLLRTRWLAHLPDTLPRPAPLRALGLATATALLALAFTLLPGLLAGSYDPAVPGWTAFEYQAEPDAFATVGGLLLLFGVQSLFEEVLFRAIGVALLALLLLKVAEVLLLDKANWRFATGRRAVEDAPTKQWRQQAWFYCALLANLMLSVGFALMHGQNPGVSTIALVNITLAGLWLGLLFMRGLVNLTAAWLAHYTWNLGLALLGLPVSGFALYAKPLGIGITGARPDWLSGGEFGVEASVLTTLAFALLCAYLLLLLVREQRAATAAAPAASDSVPPAALAG